ncbi:MAG: hypothetical protein ACI8QC_002263 [Planctomycetota bacterium]
MLLLRRLCLLLASLLAGLLPGAYGQGTGVIIREGKAFRIVCHFENSPVAERALEIADATWAPAARAYGANPRTPEDRIRVHLYDKRAEFDEACIALEGRTWPAHAGLTSARYGIAVVLMGADVNAGAQRELGVRDADLYTVAHECAHLVGTRLAPGYAEHPAWLTEGLAEEVARQVLCSAAIPLNPPPTNQTREAAAAAAYRQTGGQGLQQLLAGRPPGRDSFERYAIQGAFVRFLLQTEHSAALTRALTQPPKSGSSWSASLAAACELGRLAELEDDFAGYLAKLTPSWGLGPGHFESDGASRWLQIALDEKRAWAWKLNPSPAEAQSLRAWIEPQRSGSDASAWIAVRRLTQRRGGDSWTERILAFQIRPGEPVRLCRLSSGSAEEDKLEVLAEAPADAPRLNTEHGLGLALDWVEGDIVLQLGGKEALRLRLLAGSPASSNTSWGFGVDAGGVVRWRLP